MLNNNSDISNNADMNNNDNNINTNINYQPKSKKNKENEAPTSLIFAGLGALALSLISVLFFFISNTFIIPEGYAETTGVITAECTEPDILTDDSCNQYIKFEVNGEIYKTITKTSSDNHQHRKVGLEVKIIYNIEDPNDAQEKYAGKVPNIIMICLIIGGALVSIIAFVEAKKLTKRLNGQIQNDLRYK